MARWSNIDKMLKILDDYKNISQWSCFFEIIEEIRSLDSDINEEMHNVPSNVSGMKKNVNSKITWLQKNKEKYSQLTIIEDQYNAVYVIVSEISDEFAYLA